jgi:hypothetical protein
MWMLIQELVRLGREARGSGRKPALPPRILPAPSGPRWPAEPLDMAALFPDHPTFRERDLLALQAEVGHLRRLLTMHGQQLREWETVMNWRARMLRAYRRLRDLRG